MEQELVSALQEQFTQERYNSVAYRAMGDALDNNAWTGTAKFMRKMSNEETQHADEFAQYLIRHLREPDYQGLVGVASPESDPTMAVATALRLERSNLASLESLYDKAEESGSPETCVFLHSYLQEQTESIHELTDMLQQLQRSDCSSTLLMLDREFGNK